MPRKFTFKSHDSEPKVYEGFDMRYSPASELEAVALVRVEDSVEVYALDVVGGKVAPGAVNSLLDYLVTVHERDVNVQLLGAYYRR